MKNIVQSPPNHLLCFSHLRWDFVFQRPQHLLNRFAKTMKVYFFEEPVFDSTTDAYLSISKRGPQLDIVVPHLPAGLSGTEVNHELALLLDNFLLNANLEQWLFWYYTPMALTFSDKHKPKFLVYDCMDELSAFKFAPEELVSLEKKLLAKADLVFTGGHSLYEAKKTHHQNIYPFPSSIEKEHFGKARLTPAAPLDQAEIKGVKIGFFGVIDERFDIELIREMAEQRPEWQIILLGPVVKICPEQLPKNANIHYLGQKSYPELPQYLSGWDVAMIPFLLNESTRYISPTKTPEYLAAGKPVVSTPIRDVVKPYGVKQLVHIGENAKDFIQAIEKELSQPDKTEWLKEVDQFLAHLSWDDTHARMNKLIQDQLEDRNAISIAS